MKISDIYDYINEIAPFNTAAVWDNPGLSVGSQKNSVTTVLLALDVTKKVINEAKECGAELVVTHHPLIFDPVKSIETDSLLYAVVTSGLNFLSAHTNLDIADGGVNDCLAKKAGITSVRKSLSEMFLKIGVIDPCSPAEFAARLQKALGGTVLYCCGKENIRTVAFCSGSGGDLSSAAVAEGADALLTGEAKYDHFLNASSLGLSLFAAGHFETENPAMDHLASLLKERFGEKLSVCRSKEKTCIITK